MAAGDKPQRRHPRAHEHPVRGFPHRGQVIDQSAGPIEYQVPYHARLPANANALFSAPAALCLNRNPALQNHQQHQLIHPAEHGEH